MDVKIEGSTLPKGYDLVIPPMRDTNPLELPPSEVIATEIARKQLENLNKIERKPKKKVIADTELVSEQSSTAEVAHSPKNYSLSSPIVSKAELEEEIRQKVFKLEPTAKKVMGTIEIPQEIILSGLNTTPITKSSTEETVQMHDQELIDILEGKSEDTGLYEIVQDSHGNVIVTDTAVPPDNNSYEIVTEAKAKLLEREIAMRQIASLPMRKNKKVNQSTTPQAAAAAAQSIVQSLAAEWTDDDKDDEMIVEVVNVSNDATEPKIKILNMTILNESPENKPKLPRASEPAAEPKILNKNAPKILNINASAAEPATFKRSRIIKKKEIFDPSSEKKAVDKMSLTLPSSITIKKVTKETITKANAVAADSAGPLPVQKAPAKKGKKLSEIDKLLQDEGAVNMIYSLERENNNQDVPEINIKPDTKQLIDKSQEKSSLVSKAKAIKNVVMKQSTSPPEVKAPGRARAKRDMTPTTSAAEAKVVVPKTTAARKKKADSTWDYLYSQAQATCDDAMIIRRRSNSSYSSSAASPRRMSVDVNEGLESPPPSTKKMKQSSKDGFEFTKPPQKTTKSPADNVLNKDFVEQLRGKISNVITKNKEKPAPVAPKGRKRGASAALSEAIPAKRSSERRSNGSECKDYKLEKIQTPSGAVTHIIINQNPLSISLLSEMKSLLNQIETDGSVAVLITSSEGFSEGLDYSTLVQPTVDKRKQAASDLVTAFKNFLISLAAFPKPLVCGVDGPASGISVAMLPLFDLVLASPAAAFSLPHAKIGSNPEGISILKHSGKVNVNAVRFVACDLYLNSCSSLSFTTGQPNVLFERHIDRRSCSNQWTDNKNHR